MSLLDRIPFQPVIIAAVFLGLAPFVPEPHIWQKLKMLGSGELTQTIDIGDLLFHSAPSLLLIAKIVFGSKKGSSED
ncbi:MAG: RND transporter [Paracoccaceae bacterium]